MGLLKNCSLLIVIIAILASIGPYIYFQIDQREFNRRTTASEAGCALTRLVRAQGTLPSSGIQSQKLPNAKVCVTEDDEEDQATQQATQCYFGSQ